MTTGSPPTARNARTGLLTPPGKSCRARSMTVRERLVVIPRLTPRQEPGGVAGVVGEDEICAGALDRVQDLHHDRLAVDPAPLGRGLEHRVLAAHVVGPDW